MQHRRWTFQGGTSFKGPTGKTEARMVHGAQLVRGRLVPMPMPRMVSGTLAGGDFRAVRIHRGRAILSDSQRDFAAVQVAGQDVVAFTGAGYPAKLVAGETMPLGLPRPLKAPQVGEATVASAFIPTFQSAGSGVLSGTKYYRFAPVGNAGIGSPTPSQRVDIASPSNVLWNLPMVEGGQHYSAWLIFRGDNAGEERIIGKASFSAGTCSFLDDGKAQGFETAKSYDLDVSEVQYAYTFIARHGSRVYESAPSPVSTLVATGQGTPLIFDVLNDGFFPDVSSPGDAVKEVNLTNCLLAAPLAPCPVSTFSLHETVNAPAELGAVQRTSGFKLFAGGCGVALFDASGKYLWAESVDALERASGLPWATRLNRILFPTRAGATQAATAKFTQHGAVQSHTWDTGLGMRHAYIENCPLASGDRVIVWSVGADKKLEHTAVMTWYRDSRAGKNGYGWFEGNPGWEWASSGLNWSRNLWRVDGMRPQEALDIPSGTVARVSCPLWSQPRVAIIRHGGSSSIWLELDHLDGDDLTASKITSLRIEYYPGNLCVEGRAIYRCGDTAEWLRAAVIPLGQKTWTDAVPTFSLGDKISSHRIENNVTVQDDPPPRDLRHITTYGSIMLGLSKATGRWSRPGNPDAWPESYAQEFEDMPVVPVVHGAGALWLCRNSAWRSDFGSDGSAMFTRTAIEHGCIAPRSAVSTPHGLIYLGKDGLIITDGFTSRVLTKDRFHPGQLFTSRLYGPGLVLEDAPAGARWDTGKGQGQGLVAALECAPVVEAMACEDLLGLAPSGMSPLTAYAKATYAAGRYLLWIPAYLAGEAMGMWAFDLGIEGAPAIHYGVQPHDAQGEGSTLHLLIPGIPQE